MQNVIEQKTIPRSLVPCFQEYDFEKLEPSTHANLIIERVLAYGDRKEVRWLLKCYGQERVNEWLEYMGVRRLPWRRYNLWCVIFDIPHSPRYRTVEQRIWLY